MVERSAPQGEARSATLLVRPGAAHSLRRRATSTTEVDSGWSELSIDFHDVDGFAAEIAGHADNVRVLAPADLLDRVQTQLRATLAVHEAGV